MIRPGMVSVTFRGADPDRIIAWTADAGLEGIEWGGDVHCPPGDAALAEDIGRRTRAAGLRVFSYGSYYRAGELDARCPLFEPALESARAMGAPMIRIWAGRRGSHEADPVYRARVAGDIRRVAAQAQAHGLSVALEYHRNTLTDTPDSTAALLNDLADPALLTHWQPTRGMADEAAAASLLAVRPRLAHLHVFQWSADGRRMPLARGERRWRRFLAIAADSAREHAALLEFVAGDDPGAFRDDAATLLAWVAGPRADAATGVEP